VKDQLRIKNQMPYRWRSNQRDAKRFMFGAHRQEVQDPDRKEKKFVNSSQKDFDSHQLTISFLQADGRIGKLKQKVSKCNLEPKNFPHVRVAC